MDEKLKQRLVGAAVLVSLAVIFVPMILDKRDRDMGEVGSNLPPAPDFETRDRIRSIELPPPLPDEPIGAASGEERAAGGAAVGERPDTAPHETAGVSADREREALGKDKPKEETAVSSAPATRAPNVAERGPEASGKAEGWVVQVGSFGSEKNARALAERLRRAGFSAFVSRTEKAGKPFFRVRVGPMPERARAEGEKARLDRLLGQKTLVMRAGH